MEEFKHYDWGDVESVHHEIDTKHEWNILYNKLRKRKRRVAFFLWFSGVSILFISLWIFNINKTQVPKDNIVTVINQNPNTQMQINNNLIEEICDPIMLPDQRNTKVKAQNKKPKYKSSHKRISAIAGSTETGMNFTQVITDNDENLDPTKSSKIYNNDQVINRYTADDIKNLVENNSINSWSDLNQQMGDKSEIKNLEIAIKIKRNDIIEYMDPMPTKLDRPLTQELDILSDRLPRLKSLHRGDKLWSYYVAMNYGRPKTNFSSNLNELSKFVTRRANAETTISDIGIQALIQRSIGTKWMLVTGLNTYLQTNRIKESGIQTKTESVANQIIEVQIDRNGNRNQIRETVDIKTTTQYDIKYYNRMISINLPIGLKYQLTRSKNFKIGISALAELNIANGFKGYLMNPNIAYTYSRADRLKLSDKTLGSYRAGIFAEVFHIMHHAVTIGLDYRINTTHRIYQNVQDNSKGLSIELGMKF